MPSMPRVKFGRKIHACFSCARDKRKCERGEGADSCTYCLHLKRNCVQRLEGSTGSDTASGDTISSADHHAPPVSIPNPHLNINQDEGNLAAHLPVFPFPHYGQDVPSLSIYEPLSLHSLELDPVVASLISGSDDPQHQAAGPSITHPQASLAPNLWPPPSTALQQVDHPWFADSTLDQALPSSTATLTSTLPSQDASPEVWDAFFNSQPNRLTTPSVHAGLPLSDPTFFEDNTSIGIFPLKRPRDSDENAESSKRSRVSDDMDIDSILNLPESPGETGLTVAGPSSHFQSFNLMPDLEMLSGDNQNIEGDGNLDGFEGFGDLDFSDENTWNAIGAMLADAYPSSAGGSEMRVSPRLRTRSPSPLARAANTDAETTIKFASDFLATCRECLFAVESIRNALTQPHRIASFPELVRPVLHKYFRRYLELESVLMATSRSRSNKAIEAAPGDRNDGAVYTKDMLMEMLGYVPDRYDIEDSSERWVAMALLVMKVRSGINLDMQRSSIQNEAEHLASAIFLSLTMTYALHGYFFEAKRMYDCLSRDRLVLQDNGYNSIVQTLDSLASHFKEDESALEKPCVDPYTYKGIGVYLTYGQYPVIVKVVPGSVAAQMGLHAGDEIVGIGGNLPPLDVSESPLQRLHASVEKIRGECGEPVQLAILRAGWTTPSIVPLIREYIRIPYEPDHCEDVFRTSSYRKSKLPNSDGHLYNAEPKDTSQYDETNDIKLNLVSELVNEKMVMITIDARLDGVKVPAHLKNNCALKINISHRFETPLTLGWWGIEQELSFNGVWYACSIPWRAVFLAVQHGQGRGYSFDEHFPVEWRREAARRAFRYKVTVIWGGRAIRVVGALSILWVVLYCFRVMVMRIVKS